MNFSVATEAGLGLQSTCTAAAQIPLVGGSFKGLYKIKLLPGDEKEMVRSSVRVLSSWFRNTEILDKLHCTIGRVTRSNTSMANGSKKISIVILNKTKLLQTFLLHEKQESSLTARFSWKNFILLLAAALYLDFRNCIQLFLCNDNWTMVMGETL